MHENTRLRIFVNGRVQGVFFRKFTRDNAMMLGLTGWVKNLSDGRMEVVVEGTKDKLIELIKLIRKGPPLARIEKIEISWGKGKGKLGGFKIIY